MKDLTKSIAKIDQDSEYISNLLNQWSQGNDDVESELINYFYPQIHKIARNHFKLERASSLQTTEIVNEAFIGLRKQKSLSVKEQNHFLAICTKIIRSVIVDHFRSETRQKRGGLEVPLTLSRLEEMLHEPSVLNYDWLQVDGLINELKSIDSMAAQVVEYKIFGGFTLPEMANLLSVSESTVSRNWKFARLWLMAQMKK